MFCGFPSVTGYCSLRRSIIALGILMVLASIVVCIAPAVCVTDSTGVVRNG